jgi:hypothetical protein
MKTLRSYFENDGQQRQALNSFFAAWGDSSWLGPEVNLYNATRAAFYSGLDPTSALREFEKIDNELTGRWQVFRPYARDACWPPGKIHSTIKREFEDFAWTGSVTLMNFLKSGTGPRLQASLETLRQIKPNQGFPIMTVSKFLHFYNPALFPIYDEAVIWGKVFRRFGDEFRRFCQTTPGIRWNNDYTALWLHNYICWASFLVANAHGGFMQTFVEWLSEKTGAGFATRKYDPMTIYARAFEFTATGAAVLELAERESCRSAGAG